MNDAQLAGKDRDPNDRLVGWAAMAAVFAPLIPFLLFSAGRLNIWKYYSIYGVSELDFAHSAYDVILYGFAFSTGVLWLASLILGAYLVSFAVSVWGVSRLARYWWQSRAPRKLKDWADSQTKIIEARRQQALLEDKPGDAPRTVPTLIKGGALMVLTGMVILVIALMLHFISLESVKRAQNEIAALAQWDHNRWKL